MDDELKWYRLTDDEADRLNAPGCGDLLVHDGTLYFKHVVDENWLHVGYIPRPSSRLAWFVYHLVHGLVMRYPLHKVIGYAIFESKMEEDES